MTMDELLSRLRMIDSYCEDQVTEEEIDELIAYIKKSK